MDTTDTMDTMDIVLIPGLWLDAASWDDVTPILTEAGHRTHPLTLPGMESRDADRSHITLDDHVGAVVAAIDRVDPAAKVVLVGHSHGGVLAYAASDRRPERIAHLVYLASEPHVADEPYAEGEGGGWPTDDGEVPLPAWGFFDDEMTADLDDEQRAAIRARSIPSPNLATRMPAALSDERRLDIASTVIACEYSSAQLQAWIDAGEPSAHELSLLRAVGYVDLDSGHWPQFTRPADVARIVLDAVATADTGSS
jgi:pimeloyl-ACP methyl ester carboxylesterase